MAELMGPPPKKNIIPCHSLPEETLVNCIYCLFREQSDLKQRLQVSVNEAGYLSLAEFWIQNRGYHIGKPDWEKDVTPPNFSYAIRSVAMDVRPGEYTPKTTNRSPAGNFARTCGSRDSPVHTYGRSRGCEPAQGVPGYSRPPLGRHGLQAYPYYGGVGAYPRSKVWARLRAAQRCVFSRRVPG